MDIDRSAPVIVELEVTVEAPLAAVWDLHTDIARWPAWQTDISTAQPDGPVAPGTTFVWETAGLDITSTVREVEPRRRIVWGGPAHGIDGVHVWTFEETAAGTLVRTAESWNGEPVLSDVDGMRDALHGALSTWLAHLKSTAESAAASGSTRG
ncbi:SRPBCC family protein [Streptomyces sp. NPDC047108]|uniref:SRPBCC family protein n=1 Tax=Streptomyces sp. NPDC047108 TaxID=3155025 RepID=UPI003407E18C